MPKTVWKRARHDAGKWGSRTLRELLGSVSFDYAKSPYAVLDTLRTIVGNKPDALVVDFFAGSGTTLHSVLMLNAEDGGERRCVLVTNNQVDEATAKLLNEAGKFVGDAEYEARGICQSVTIPRVTAAITGARPDGQRIEGAYQDGRSIADGFDENAEFFKLNYVDRDQIDLGRQLEAIVPSLWLAAGGVGTFEVPSTSAGYSMPESSNYALLLRESGFRELRAALAERPDVTHVWIVTDSQAAFAEMAEELRSTSKVSMLYRDYLENFRINVDHTAVDKAGLRP